MVQAALKSVLEPIFEADFAPCSYGVRPNRRGQDAIAEVQHLTTRGYEWVLEAEVAACFDSIDHTAVMNRLRVRISDKHVLALVKAFLKAGMMTTSGDREQTLTGTPQGWDHDSSNAVGNFCFEVSLSYRRAERPRRVAGRV